MALDVAELADLKHERAHGLVIRRVEDDDSVVRAHRPEFLYDLHPHFLGLRHRSIAAFDRILDITDALVSKLNQTNISSHDFLLSCGSASKLFQIAPYAKRSTAPLRVTHQKSRITQSWLLMSVLCPTRNFEG